MEFRIACWGHKNHRFVHAFDKDDKWLSTVSIELDCGEYPRYKNLCNGEKIAKIVRVETDPQYVGNGIASELLRYTITIFNEYNIVLLCNPQPRWEDTDTLKTISDLKKFYSKFGFVPCGELLPTMIRKARN
jgi:GNAT superfamily N-acetyltransferase